MTARSIPRVFWNVSKAARSETWGRVSAFRGKREPVKKAYDTCVGIAGARQGFQLWGEAGTGPGHGFVIERFAV